MITYAFDPQIFVTVFSISSKCKLLFLIKNFFFKLGLLTSTFFLMVKAHLKQFTESRNSFTCSSILPTSLFFSPDRLSQEDTVQKLIFSFAANG